MLPYTLFDEGFILYPNHITTAMSFRIYLDHYNSRSLKVTPFEFQPTNFGTNKFDAWWVKDWVFIEIPIVDCYQRMTAAFGTLQKDPTVLKS